MKPAAKQRAVSIDDVCREYLRAKSASLEEQLEVSLFVEKIKREMATAQQQTEPGNPHGVYDNQRKWRLLQEG